MLACLFYTYYIFERFCVPVFQNFNRESVTPRALLLSVFGSMMPATLVLFIGELFHFVKKKVRCTFLNRFAYLLRCFCYHTEPDSQPCHLSLPYNHCECSLDLFLLMFHLRFIIKTVTSLSIKWRIVLIIISMTLCVSAVD